MSVSLSLSFQAARASPPRRLVGVDAPEGTAATSLQDEVADSETLVLSMGPPSFEKSRSVRTSAFHPEFQPEDFAVEILETRRQEGGAENLFTAEIVVSGGLRCGEIDGFQAVRDLVDTLREQGVNADWGASRHAVDRGYVPYERQIGQTGKTVRPKVYIAVAISGAIQHLAGIKESGRIVAINHHSQANIFRHADIGICKNDEAVLPELVRRVREQGFTFGVKGGGERGLAAR